MLFNKLAITQNDLTAYMMTTQEIASGSSERPFLDSSGANLEIKLPENLSKNIRSITFDYTGPVKAIGFDSVFKASIRESICPRLSGEFWEESLD
jgi:exoribonuclease II